MADKWAAFNLLGLGLANEPEIRSSVFDTEIEPGWSMLKVMRVMAATLAGEVSGSSSNSPVFKSIDGLATRISATTTAKGDRSGITLNGD